MPRDFGSNRTRISHRLSKILRYEVDKRGLTRDQRGYVLFDDIYKHFQREFDKQEVIDEAFRSEGSRGLRFDLVDDRRRGLLIRANQDCGARAEEARHGNYPDKQRCRHDQRRGPPRPPLSSPRCRSRSRSPPRFGGFPEGAISESERDQINLLEFLRGLKNWLAGHHHAPDAASLQTFAKEWRTTAELPREELDDRSRARCLQLLMEQVSSFKKALHDKDQEHKRQWENCCLSDFLKKFDCDGASGSWDALRTMLERAQKEE
eukprot:TRINITY_DN20367_c0_g1_i3.p1 TRINITY_DN20367_c0_g1~~TRINITY_DN20367_c0_g1_i3.p1  ORF type:complete len:263 (-),score=43.61 TRINITY_DN20367_c0_g1_i3:325-1113(-)